MRFQTETGECAAIVRGHASSHEVMHLVSFRPVKRWIAARSISRPTPSAGSPSTVPQSPTHSSRHQAKAKRRTATALDRETQATLEGSGSPAAFPLSIAVTSDRFLAPSMMLQTHGPGRDASVPHAKAREQRSARQRRGDRSQLICSKPSRGMDVCKIGGLFGRGSVADHEETNAGRTDIPSGRLGAA